MTNSQSISTNLILLCIVVTCDVLLAKPLDLGPAGRFTPSAKLLQALSNKHSNSQGTGKLDRSSILLHELLYSPKSYSGNENTEAHQVGESGNLQYSPLEYLQALADYEGNDDYYQDQTNADGQGFYYADGQDGWFDGPILPKVDQPVEESADDQLNKLLVNYLYEHYSKLNPNENEDEDDSNVQKRRQKIVIKEDLTELTTPSSAVSSTSGPRKTKLLHKPVKSIHHGQKEVALLRPAESKQKEWPSELEENNLDEVSRLL